VQTSHFLIPHGEGKSFPAMVDRDRLKERSGRFHSLFIVIAGPMFRYRSNFELPFH
jgi:hypothetical protein